MSLQLKHYLFLCQQSLTSTSGAIKGTANRLFFIWAAIYLVTPAQIGVEPEIPQEAYVPLAVDEINDLTVSQEEVAREIERVLREEGFEKPEIQAAIINGLAESDLDPSAVGDHGNSRGVFQLNKNGLGNKMKREDMHDVEIATRRVAIAMRKSDSMMREIDRGASVEQLTATFCVHIMRPSNKMRKAKIRAESARKMVVNT